VKLTQWKDRLRRVVNAVQPYTDVAERVAYMAVRVQNLTPVSAVGLVATGANSIRSILDDRNTPHWDLPMLVSRGHLVEALTAMGARVRAESARAGQGGHGERTVVTFGGEQFFISAQGALVHANPSPEFSAWVRQALDRTLPRCMRVGLGPAGIVSASFEPTRLRSAEGERIAAATRPMLEAGPRCVLLDGRPGVGKSTMAQEIPQLLGLGRIAIVEGSLLGSARAAEPSVSAISNETSGRDGPRPESFAMLCADCIIVDDIDKVYLSLDRVEAMRASCRLLILTSNNGGRDDVLDNSLVRPGRVDERFVLAGGHADRAAPFDQLDDVTWEEVRDWPVASQNELAARIKHRGMAALNIEDLRERVSRRTRSAGVLG
jgi:hypothetical protein